MKRARASRSAFGPLGAFASVRNSIFANDGRQARKQAFVLRFGPQADCRFSYNGSRHARWGN